jgi:hypothetical protein
MLMFVNPIIMTVIGYLSVTAYFGCVESPHPFKAFRTLARPSPEVSVGNTHHARTHTHHTHTHARTMMTHA